MKEYDNLSEREKAEFDEATEKRNEAYYSFYDLIVSRFEDYNLGTPTDFTLASGVSSFPLPSDFYKLAGVDRKTSTTEFYPLRNVLFCLNLTNGWTACVLLYFNCKLKKLVSCHTDFCVLVSSP